MGNYKIKSETDFEVNYIQYKKGDDENYFFNDSIGIIKNYEKCMNDITRLEFKEGIYYLFGNKYLNEEDYKKYVNEYFSKISKKLHDTQEYATLKHIGGYDTIYESYNKLLNAINIENKKIVGPPMEQFISGRWNEKDKNKYVTNIMIPISKK